MRPEAVAALFTRSDGSYLFARWGRPIVPVVFGVTAATLGVVKGALKRLPKSVQRFSDKNRTKTKD